MTSDMLHRVLVDPRAADEPHVAAADEFQRLFDGARPLDARNVDRAAGHDDIAAPLKRLADGLERGPAHDDRRPSVTRLNRL